MNIPSYLLSSNPMKISKIPPGLSMCAIASTKADHFPELGAHIVTAGKGTVRILLKLTVNQELIALRNQFQIS